MRNENKTLLERNVISSILSNLDLLDSLDIDIGDFQPKHRDLLKAIKENQTNDATILATNSNRPIEDIYDIIWCVMYASDWDFQNYVEQLKELITRDKLRLTLDNMILRLNAWGDSESVYSELNKLKLEFTDKYDDTILENNVISANYKQGDIVAEGTVIEVVISRGKLVMTDFETYNEFREWADKYGIKYDEQHEFSNDVKAGEAISYSYKKGETIKNNDVIVVTVSDGKEATVANRINGDVSKEKIEKKLESNNFIN
mgnify:CR=1 FL=1